MECWKCEETFEQGNDRIIESCGHGGGAPCSCTRLYRCYEPCESTVVLAAEDLLAGAL